MANWIHVTERLGPVIVSRIHEEGTERRIATMIIEASVSAGFILPEPDCTYREAALLRNGFKQKEFDLIIIGYEDFSDFLENKEDVLSPFLVMAGKHVLDTRTTSG